MKYSGMHRRGGELFHRHGRVVDPNTTHPENISSANNVIISALPSGFDRKTFRQLGGQTDAGCLFYETCLVLLSESTKQACTPCWILGGATILRYVLSIKSLAERAVDKRVPKKRMSLFDTSLFNIRPH